MIVLTGVSGRGAPQEEGSPPLVHRRLVVGQEKSIVLDYVAGRVVVSDPATCDYKISPGGREILIVAKVEGRAVLTVWDEHDQRRPNLEIDVVSAEFIGRLDALDPLLAPYPNLRARTLGTRVAITGTVATQAEREAVQAIAAAQGDVVVLVSVAQTAPSPPAPPAATPAPTPPAPSTPALPPGAATPVPLTSAPHGTGTAPAPRPERVVPTPPVRETRPATPTPTPSPAPTPAGAPSTAVPAAPATPTAPGVAGGSLVPPTPAEPEALPARPTPPGDTAPPPVSAQPAVPAPPPSATKPVVPAPASTAVDYVIELLEFPAAAPVSAFLDPTGQSLLRLRLSTTNTMPVRHSIRAGEAGAAEGVTGSGRFDISLEPLVDTEGVVHTTLVVDTNLTFRPRSGASAGRSQWARAQVKFSSIAGETRAVTEQALAETVTAGEPGAEPRPDESSAAGRLAELFAATQGEQRLVVLVTPFLTDAVDPR